MIQAIRVRDFRSLASVDVSGLGEIVPIVGPNGGGKSNLLRAVNLFFNDEVEPGQALVLGRDFRDPGRNARQVISIEFDLSFGGGLRKELREPLDRFAAATDVTIRRRFFFDPVTREQTHDLAIAAIGAEPADVPAGDRAVVQRLLNSVRFRYLSNHIHPTQLLIQEEGSIRRMLFDRLRKSPSFSDEQIGRIQETARELMSPITRELAASTGRLRRVELGTPSDWRDLVWALG